MELKKYRGMDYDPAMKVSGVVIDPRTRRRVFVPSPTHARFATIGDLRLNRVLEDLARELNGGQAVKVVKVIHVARPSSPRDSLTGQNIANPPRITF